MRRMLVMACAAGLVGASAPVAGAETASGADERGKRTVFVAYYGTAGTGALGVLGEGSPRQQTRKLRKVAARYRTPSTRPQIVYELIVTVADRSPGPDGSYSHHIDRAKVQRYIKAAHRYDARLVLDIQPGRAGFLPNLRHWRWALTDPRVSVALDPEWRMGPGQVPGQVVGHVGAAEVNRASRFVERLTKRRDLPRKLFIVHQFRTSMVRNIERVRSRPHLRMLQHVDGFGTRRAKLATYHAVARPQQFSMGFKLFYDEDVQMFRPKEVLRIKPRVSFVSYQ